MSSRHLRLPSIGIAIVAGAIAIGRAQAQLASWLDTAKPTSWNSAGMVIPAAPPIPGNVNPRCRELARPPQLEEDKRVRDQGWDLVGAFQGGWQILVIRGAAGYDGMCRPLQFQDFVFVRGSFAGTLSPRPVDSRADGALGRVIIESDRRLVAEYARYSAADPLCCPSRTTAVAFDIANDLIVRPASASTARR
ncbi:MAG TPA: LppP/LprE family lipoprotein [Vicinamibacterales bacterium]|nr:LppP/LprE family lipoprotein [Vicinamibacterales bacterium]